MTFSSPGFILAFLPLLIAFFVALSKAGMRKHAGAFFLLASLLFVGLSGLFNLGILLFSVLFNWAMGIAISKSKGRSRVASFALALAGNLLLLGFFKYGGLLPAGQGLLLPLGISFYTFTQITYQIEVFNGSFEESRDLGSYALFATFFPYVTSGPITRYEESASQFASNAFGAVSSYSLAKGLTLFVIGLFKKVVIADHFGGLASAVFDSVALGFAPSYGDAWLGALAYSLQIYFDFSGYSDMAIGIAFIFGVQLPWNFNSPYKARNVIEFWRRWHITLSNWLRDYVFTPLAMAIGRFFIVKKILVGRADKISYAICATFTMLLCGIWHGAGWNFVLWGLVHGVFMAANQLLAGNARTGRSDNTFRFALEISRLKEMIAIVVTFLAITWAWVLFRSQDVAMAKMYWWGMIGGNGFAVLPSEHILTWKSSAVQILAGMAFVWFLPNSNQIFNGDIEFRNNAALRRIAGKTGFGAGWNPSAFWALFVAVIAIVSLLSLSKVEEFVYMRF